MQKFRLKQTISMVLILLLTMSCLSAVSPVHAADKSAPDAIVVACSDFQNFADSNRGGYSGSYTNNIAVVSGILNAMNYESIDGFICGGDYNFAETINNVSQTQTGITALRNTVTAHYPDLPDERIVTVQGNHDAAGTLGMAVTGPYEAAAYSVYAINEDDYMDRNTDEARIKATADGLAAWLADKAAAEYRRPIFVVTHLPLHFTTRTQKNGDGQYAHYLFDVLNRYGEQLNIIFLFGHNHAFGYDSYMGASSILLQRGDTLKIAQLGSRTSYTEEPLNFTYMNCGYIGYYWFNYNTSGNAITQNPPADSTMTMTSFEITGEEVVIHRWDENGLHNLKAPGARVTKAMNGTNYEDLWEANDLAYGPTVNVSAPAPAATYTDQSVSVTTAAPIEGIRKLAGSGNEKTVSFEIKPLAEVRKGYTYTVTISVDAAMATQMSIVELDGEKIPFTAAPDPENPAVGTITVRTDRLGAFSISIDETIASYTRVTDLRTLPESGQYLLFVSNTNKTSGSNLNEDYVMRPVSKYVNNAGTEVDLASAYRTGFDIESALRFDIDNQTTFYGSEATLAWTLERSGDNWILKTGEGGVHFAYKDASAATVTVSKTDPTPLAIERYGSTDTFTIGTASVVNGATYFFDYNTRGIICGYRAHANDVHFYIYQQGTGYTVGVDTSYLEAALAEAEALSESDYTPASWARLAAAVAEGRELLADPELRLNTGAQTRINAAWIALTKAQNGLKPASDPDPDPFRFDDVQDESGYFFAPVYWAYTHDPQITNGASETLFNPFATCTRAQVVTFLWRAKGCPAPTASENPFTDVEAGKYYSDAVLWAVENEITAGTGKTTFSPDQGCTRAQVVTFLWRAAGKPAAGSNDNPFTDVKAGQYYYDAVRWAVESGVTTGTGETTFSPNKTCTRAQIVTFLYRTNAD